MAKYMFLKKFKNHNLDPTIEFFKYAGTLYNPELGVELEEGVEEKEEDDEEDDVEDNAVTKYGNYF